MPPWTASCIPGTFLTCHQVTLEKKGFLTIPKSINIAEMASLQATTGVD